MLFFSFFFKAVQEGFGGRDLSPDGKFKVLMNELDERSGLKILDFNFTLVAHVLSGVCHTAAQRRSEKSFREMQNSDISVDRSSITENQPLWFFIPSYLLAS